VLQSVCVSLIIIEEHARAGECGAEKDVFN